MKAKFYGISVFLLASVCFFHSEILAQKNGQFTLKKIEATDSNDLSKAVLDEINAVRQNPQQFVKYLEDYRKRFSGSRVREPDGKYLITIEGIAAVDETIAYLKNHSPVQLLSANNNLVKSAHLQLQDLIVNRSLGHIGADGSSLSQRIKRFGSVKGKLGENIAFRRNDAREILLMWLIDDGVQSRLHRHNILNSAFKKAGIAYGTATDGTPLCVLVLAEDFLETKKQNGLQMF